MSALVIFRLSATGPGADPDSQNCTIALAPSIWVNQGGRWGAQPGDICTRSVGEWRPSRVDQGTIIGVNDGDASDQVFQLQGVPSPMTATKAGTGALFKAGNRLPDGPIRWEIVNVNAMGTGTATGDSDGGDDD